MIQVLQKWDVFAARLHAFSPGGRTFMHETWWQWYPGLSSQLWRRTLGLLCLLAILGRPQRCLDGLTSEYLKTTTQQLKMVFGHFLSILLSHKPGTKVEKAVAIHCGGWDEIDGGICAMASILFFWEWIGVMIHGTQNTFLFTFESVIWKIWLVFLVIDPFIDPFFEK